MPWHCSYSSINNKFSHSNVWFQITKWKCQKFWIDDVKAANKIVWIIKWSQTTGWIWIVALQWVRQRKRERESEFHERRKKIKTNSFCIWVCANESEWEYVRALLSNREMSVWLKMEENNKFVIANELHCMLGERQQMYNSQCGIA